MATVSTRASFWRKERSSATHETHARSGSLSDFILGAQDGLVNVLGVILGVAIASLDLRIILVAGLAATFAESISMGAVAYTSTVARRDHYRAEQENERREMKESPEVERGEVRTIFAEWGFEGKELDEMVERITSNEKAWLEIMMAHELKLAPVEDAAPKRSALLVGVSAVVGSLVPLGPFLIPGVSIMNQIEASLIVSAIVLFAIGWHKAKSTVGSPGKSGVQMAVIGIASALAGFLIGYLLSPGAVI